jgi:hypothetical protein
MATDPEVRVRFPALSDFPRSSGSETGLLSLVSTIEELLERKSGGSGLEYCRTDHATPSTKVVTNFADKRRSMVGTVRSRTQATEFSFFFSFRPNSSKRGEMNGDEDQAQQNWEKVRSWRRAIRREEKEEEVKKEGR